MLDLRSHPTHDLLRDFLLGKLCNPADGDIEAHFDACQDCHARAAAYGTENAFVELLAAAGMRAAVFGNLEFI